MGYGDYNRLNNFRNPFGNRPWLDQNGAAAAAPGNTGIKGIVAGGITGLYLISKFIT